MATMRVDGFELQEKRLDRLGRDVIRKVVEAGAGAAMQIMRNETRARQHVKTGDMLEAIGMNEYREYLGGGSVEVYPQGEDRRGVRNATKAYVINYGRGGTRQRGRMGDKFITGNERATEDAVERAMQAESDRLIAETE